MRQYVVVEECYVPVGERGGLRFKVPGQVVTLDERDAKDLGKLVKPASERVVAAQVVAGPTVTDNEGTDDADSSAPTQSDNKDAWVDFAESKGLERSKAEAMTKAELVEKFGPK